MKKRNTRDIRLHPQPRILGKISCSACIDSTVLGHGRELGACAVPSWTSHSAGSWEPPCIDFTDQEEKLIVHLQALLGNRYRASYLPKRMDNAIKNY
nr:unnamed protein product [Digitaria exilis]